MTPVLLHGVVQNDDPFAELLELEYLQLDFCLHYFGISSKL